MLPADGTDPPGDTGRSMPTDDLADLTHEILMDLYDDDLLNEAAEKLSSGAVGAAMRLLEGGLNERLLDSSDREWQGFVQLCLAHPLRQLLHQDPFTRHAYEKPRGYPGDPELLDYIFQAEQNSEPPQGTTPLGRQIFAYTTRSTLCEGVRECSRWVARTIDQRADGARDLQLLSVVGGHLREAAGCKALREGRIGRWVALDSDTDSLQEVRRRFAGNVVETYAGSVRQLVGGKLQLGHFDVIYSTLLFNYLEQSVGRRLVEQLFAMLRPGGQMLIANLADGVRERGYMESFMDWNLTYRSQHEMRDLASAVDEAALSKLRVVTADRPAGETERVLILQLNKA